MKQHNIQSIFPHFRLRRLAVVRFYGKLICKQLTMKQTFTMRFAAIGVAMLTVLIGGSAYSYYSPSVTHGDTLYNVKKGIESVRLSFANNLDEKVHVHTDLANRRLAEAKVLAEAQGISEDELLSLLGGGVAFAQTDETEGQAEEDANATDGEETTEESNSDGSEGEETNNNEEPEAQEEVTEEEAVVDSEVGTDEEGTDISSENEDSTSEEGSEEGEEPLEEDPLAETVEDMQENMDEAGEAAEEMTDLSDIQEALETIQTAQADQLAGLEQIAEDLGAELSDEAVEEIALAFDDIEDTQVRIDAAQGLVEELLAAGESETEEDIAIIEGNEKGGGTLPENEDEETAEEVTGGDQIAIEEIALVEDPRVVELRRDISLFRASLSEEGIDEGQTGKLINRLEKKASQIERAIEKGNENQAAGLQKAFRAIKKNSKRFVKKKGKPVFTGESHWSDEEERNEIGSEQEESEKTEETTQEDTTTEQEEENDDVTTEEENTSDEDTQGETEQETVAEDNDLEESNEQDEESSSEYNEEETEEIDTPEQEPAEEEVRGNGRGNSQKEDKGNADKGNSGKQKGKKR